jgi:hypothetical protein
MPVPATKVAKVSLLPTGDSVKDVKADLTMPLAQWSKPARLCADVGFGEARTVGLTFNKYGQTTEFAWNSEARGETITGGIAGMAPDLVSFGKTVAGPSEIDEQKREIDRLETQQKLEALRACQRIKAAGGTCPPAS